MAIRLRLVNGKMIAICAARSVPKDDDIYLDDAAHSALANKFSRDYHEMYGFDLPNKYTDSELAEREESNNINRDWWDSVYGT